jgi:hypothetical protein
MRVEGSGQKQRWIKRAVKTAGDECIDWPFRVSDRGYPKLGDIPASHAALEVDGRTRPTHSDGTKAIALHSCDRPVCVNPRHLRWGTQGENIEDAFRRDRRSATGDHNPNSKLTHGDVRCIKLRIARGEPQRVIADDFGVSRSAIAMISNGSRWNNDE